MEHGIDFPRMVRAALARPRIRREFGDASHKIVTAALLASVAIAGVTGCGKGKGGSDAGQSGAPAASESAPQLASKAHDVCSLVGKADMEAILEGAVVRIAPTESGFSPDGCEYAGPPGSGRSAVVSVAWEDGTVTMAGFSAGVNLVNSQMPPGSATKDDGLKGLGDEAHLLHGGVLGVRKGDRFLSVMVVMQADSQRKAEAIARKALPGI